MTFRVRVVTMQKNEGPVLAEWLDYYAGLFGMENLTVLDNGSTDIYTLQLLHYAERKGARIKRDCPDYNRKGDYSLQALRDETPKNYDFYLPVDCDEHLAVFTRTGLSTRREDIDAELSKYKGHGHSLGINSSLFNDPGMKDVYTHYMGFNKAFFCQNSIGPTSSLDHGNHTAVSHEDKRTVPTNFTYLHYHNRPLDILKQVNAAKRQRIIDEGHTDPAPIAYLDMVDKWTKEEYHNRYKGWLRIYFKDGVVRLMLPDDEGRDYMWDGHFYVRANADVSKFYTLGALHHYLVHGHREGRAPTWHHLNASAVA